MVTPKKKKTGKETSHEPPETLEPSDSRDSAKSLESLESLDLVEGMDADQALFEGRIGGVIATFRSDQRPLQGLAGLLDWRFQGAISSFLKKGFITGEPGECAYLPLARADRTYHVLLVGTGSAEQAAQGLTSEAAQALKKNLASLKIPRLGASRSDLGQGIGALKGIPLCIVR